MPRGVYDRGKKPTAKPVDPMEVGGPEDIEVEVEVTKKPQRSAQAGLQVSVAWVQALEPMSIPGVKSSTPAPRVDPCDPASEWRNWRIVVAGPSIFLIAPKGWARGIVDATNGLAQAFVPVAEAHGWEGPEHVRQVFEFPRSKFLIRYFIADDPDAETDFDDKAIADGLRGAAVLGAPDAATRAVAEQLAAEEKAAEEEARREAARIAAKRMPKPPPKPVKAGKAAAKKSVDDDEAGMGDEGDPEPDDDEDGE